MKSRALAGRTARFKIESSRQSVASPACGRNSSGWRIDGAYSGAPPGQQATLARTVVRACSRRLLRLDLVGARLMPGRHRHRRRALEPVVMLAILQDLRIADNGGPSAYRADAGFDVRAAPRFASAPRSGTALSYCATWYIETRTITQTIFFVM